MLPLAFFGQLHQLYVDDMVLLFRGEENWFLFILTNRLGEQFFTDNTTLVSHSVCICAELLFPIQSLLI